MDICTDFDVAMSQYIVELYGERRTKAVRTNVELAVGNDHYSFIQTVNAIICAAQQKCGEAFSIEDAISMCKKEFEALHFDDHFCSWDFYDEVAHVVIGVKKFKTLTESDKLKTVNSVFQTGTACPDIYIRAGMILYCLRIMTRFGLMTKDIDLMKRISQAVSGLNEQEKANAVIPDCFVREI
jgi:hypothetical protein